MTIRLVAVAIGVMNEAAPATQMHIITGWGDTPMPTADASATGMTISVVAVLLMIWPSVAVSRNSPVSRPSGPSGRTTSTSAAASAPAAPVASMAVDSGIIAPTRMTVVQLTALKAASTVVTPVRISRPAAVRPAITGGTTPVASNSTMPIRIATALRAPAPSGAAWRRTKSGALTSRTSGVPRRWSSAFQVPFSSSVSPTSSAVSPSAISVPLRWIARITRSPSGLIMPGKTMRPTSADRGGMMISASPVVQLSRVSAPPRSSVSRNAR